MDILITIFFAAFELIANIVVDTIFAIVDKIRGRKHTKRKPFPRKR